MQRSFIPFMLISFGMAVGMLSSTMPLFEWAISIEKADFPSTYRTRLDPSPWVTKLGESLDTTATVFQHLSITDEEKLCINRESFLLTVDRLSYHRWIENLFARIGQFSSSFIIVSLAGIILAAIYMWWVILGVERRPLLDGVLASVAGLGFCSILVAVLALLGPASLDHWAYISDRCRGTLHLQARLTRFRYETAAMLFIGFIVQFSGFGVMLWRVGRAIVPRVQPTLG